MQEFSGRKTNFQKFSKKFAKRIYPFPSHQKGNNCTAHRNPEAIAVPQLQKGHRMQTMLGSAAAKCRTEPKSAKVSVRRIGHKVGSPS